MMQLLAAFAFASCVYVRATIDEMQFALHSDLWTKSHASWIGASGEVKECLQSVVFPACIDDQDIDFPHGTCPDAKCIALDECVPTPQDTIDYLPPDFPSKNRKTSVCDSPDYSDPVMPPYFGLDRGVPPFYNPINAVPLKIRGTVSGNNGGNVQQCVPLPGAKIKVWHVDPLLFGAGLANQSASLRDMSCSGIAESHTFSSEESDAHKFTTSGNSTYDDFVNTGQYFFSTAMPPSYGPPRHVNFMVTADGYEPLITRLYFASDWRLQQLATFMGEVDNRNVYPTEKLHVSGLMRGFDTDDDVHRGENDMAHQLPGVIGRDPRVKHVKFVPRPNDITEPDIPSGTRIGHFEVTFDVVLKPLRQEATSSTQTPTDLTGIWAEEGVNRLSSGSGLIKVETVGNIFHATEYPHPRNWGTVSGFLSTGNTIRGVDFRHPATYNDYLRNPSDMTSYLSFPFVSRYSYEGWEFPDWALIKTNLSLGVNSDVNIENTVKQHVYDSPTKMVGNGEVRYIKTSATPETTTLWTSSAVSIGLVSPMDPFSSLQPSSHTLAPAASPSAAITWSGAGYEARWTKQPDSKQYRYLKLQITRETGGIDGGVLHINEITFYDGLLEQREIPAEYQKMTTPRFPSPFRVTCSSYQDQDHHCFKVFDGNPNSTSAWVTKPVGSSSNQLSIPQWVLLDLGPDRNAYPTSVRIACGMEHPEAPLGCPKTFTLFGSEDNSHYHIITFVDLYDYANDYGMAQMIGSQKPGKTFHFNWDSAAGRPLGQRCGSCDTSPFFACSLSAYDGTCGTRYCTMAGVCGTPDACDAGSYRDLVGANVQRTATVDVLTTTYPMIPVCRQCAAGRYGNTNNMTSQYCSGTCAVGYYCPAGSVSNMAVACGDSSVYCPAGSGEPVPCGAGKKTLSEDGRFNFVSVQDSSTSIVHHTASLFPNQVGDALCSKGHYCVDGIEIPCPMGRYGDSEGLAVSACTGQCIAGEYCPPGTVTPILCPKGHYCPDGLVFSPCPAGSFGALRGATNMQCSGKCAIGYYCPEGSISSRSVGCPAGRFGDSVGMMNQDCSGPCSAGYYCPEASVSSMEIPCAHNANNTIVHDGAGGVGFAAENTTLFDVSLSGLNNVFYCPEHSAYPLSAKKGYFTVGVSAITREAQVQCAKGFFCERGRSIACPAGTYGDVEGLTYEIMQDHWVTTNAAANVIYSPEDHLVTAPVTSSPTSQPTFVIETSYDYNENAVARCSGFCSPGYYCPENSTHADEIACPAGRIGGTGGQRNALCTSECPLGYYCPPATVVAIPCPPGIFGNTTGLQTPQCNPLCNMESAVSTGPTGVGHSICSDNLCTAGYYCPEGSISGEEHECGSAAVYCPEGSAAPIGVSEGYYTFTIDSKSAKAMPLAAPYRQTHQLPCPKGKYCVDGIARSCPAGYYGDALGQFSPTCSGLCDAGYYCPTESTRFQQIPCPAGRFGLPPLADGSNTSVSRLLTDSSCSGPCDAGYFCPRASRQANAQACGVEGSNAMYCTAGLGLPIPVLTGYYSVGGDLNTRIDVVPCPLGSYCKGGVIHDCPSGRYGRAERLSNANCSGSCQIGHYCPPGSISQNEIPCPAGRFGSERGLTSQECSGPCANPLHCINEGSTEHSITSVTDVLHYVT